MYVYFHVNFNVLFKLKKVRLLVSELYMNFHSSICRNGVVLSAARG